jgi:hypothetical protein
MAARCMNSFSEKKLSEVPPEINKLSLRVALDTSITQGAIHVFAYFVREGWIRCSVSLQLSGDKP